jgi:hypothetical protein
MRAARPYFTDSEICFLLGILRDAEAAKKRQILSHLEEQHTLQRSISALQTRMFSEGPLHVYKDLKNDKVRLEQLTREWLPTYDKQQTVLHGLCVRLEKNLRHKRGPVHGLPPLYTQCLRELSLSL